MADGNITKETSVKVGITGALALDLVPVTEISLKKVKLRVVKLAHAVPISGKHKNLPEKTYNCAMWWIVLSKNAQGKERRQESRVDAKLVVTGKDTFEIKAADGTTDPVLTVFEHGLFGNGTVGIRIRPEFPHCPTHELAEAGITFDNPITSSVKPVEGEKEAVAIGTRMEISVDIERALPPVVQELRKKDGRIRLSIHESDIEAEEGERPSSVDYQRSFEWSMDEVEKTLEWRVGFLETKKPAELPAVKITLPDYGVFSPGILDVPAMQVTTFFDTLGIFDFMEMGKHYEFTRTLSVSRDGKVFREAEQWDNFLRVERPRLESFFLSIRDHDDRLALMASGSISGFDPKMAVRLEIGLWLKAKEKKKYRALVNVEAATLLGGNFECELHVFDLLPELSVLGFYAPCFDSLAEALRKYEGRHPGELSNSCFATLRIHEESLSDDRVPIRRVFLLNEEKFELFDDLKGVIPKGKERKAARCVCSQEAKGAEDFAKKLLNAYEQRCFEGAFPQE